MTGLLSEDKVDISVVTCWSTYWLHCIYDVIDRCTMFPQNRHNTHLKKTDTCKFSTTSDLSFRPYVDDSTPTDLQFSLDCLYS